MKKESFVHYSVGVPRIDWEHFKIFELIDRVESFIRGGVTEQVFESLMELGILIQDHLKEEEEMMEEIHYSFLDGYKKDHSRIIGELVKLYKVFLESIYFCGSTNNMFIFFRDHIDHQDRQYMECYREFMHGSGYVVIRGQIN